MRNREQNGMIIRIGDNWYVRYWERRNVGGDIERKRVTHQLGPLTTRGKKPPADIVKEAERHMATVNGGAIPPERIITVGDFVERVYLPWVDQHKRPSTAKGYKDIWRDHLKPLSERVWLRGTRTYNVQGWLDQIGAGSLSRNTLKRIKSAVSGIFTLAKQQDYFQGENPTRDTRVKSRRRRAPRDLCLQLGRDKDHPKHAPRACVYSLCGRGFHGLATWGDSGAFMGELPRRRNVYHPVNMERPKPLSPRRARAEHRSP